MTPLKTMLEFPTNPEMRRLSREEKTELNERIDAQVEAYLEKVLGPDLSAWYRRMQGTASDGHDGTESPQIEEGDGRRDGGPEAS